MDTTVANAPIDMGFPQDDAAATGADYVDVSALMNETGAPTVAPTEPVATVQAPQDDAAKGGKGFIPQADFNRILGERLGDERKKYEATPEFMLGQQLIRERAARDGVSADEAYRRITDDHIKQRAEQYDKNPKEFYADMLRQQMTPNTPPTPQPPRETPASAMTLTQQLLEAGAPSMGFLPQHITPQFAADAQELGVRAALALWKRGMQAQPQSASPEAIIDQIEQRRRAPQPMRPTTQASGAPSYDYASMSTEEFRKLEQQIKKATSEGRRVRL